MSKLDDLGAYFCSCDGTRETMTVRQGVLVHSPCGLVVPCDFENGRQHAAAHEVGEYVACTPHEPRAESAINDLDDDEV